MLIGLFFIIVNSVCNAALSVEIIVIGSESRPQFRYLIDKYVSNKIKVHFYTELNAGECTLCNMTDVHSGPYVAKHVTEKEYGPTWTERSKQWWCAQRRPIAALHSFLQHRMTMLPKLLFVMDDDTWLNMPKFYEHIDDILRHKYNDTTDLYLGQVPHRRSFCMGGAGYYLSRSLILKMAEHLQKCLQLQQGGSWCFLHSDWAIARCIYAHANVSCSHTQGLVQQANKVTNKFIQSIVTYHQLPSQLMEQHYNNNENAARSKWNSTALLTFSSAAR